MTVDNHNNSDKHQELIRRLQEQVAVHVRGLDNTIREIRRRYLPGTGPHSLILTKHLTHVDDARALLRLVSPRRKTSATRTSHDTPLQETQRRAVRVPMKRASNPKRGGAK